MISVLGSIESRISKLTGKSKRCVCVCVLATAEGFNRQTPAGGNKIPAVMSACEELNEELMFLLSAHSNVISERPDVNVKRQTFHMPAWKGRKVLE